MICNDCNADAPKYFLGSGNELVCQSCYCVDDPETYEAEKPIIFLDVDGVLLDTSQALLAQIDQRFNKRPVESDLRNFDLMWSFGVPKADLDAMWNQVWNTPLLPYEGAEDFVKTLRTEYNVAALSYRKRGQPRKAANRDFPQLNFHGIFLLQPGNGLSKGAIVDSLDGVCVVEDNIQNALQIAERSDAQVLLMDRPWNQSLDLSNLYTRVFSYDDILDLLDV